MKNIRLFRDDEEYADFMNCNTIPDIERCFVGVLKQDSGNAKLRDVALIPEDFTVYTKASTNFGQRLQGDGDYYLNYQEIGSNQVGSNSFSFVQSDKLVLAITLYDGTVANIALPNHVDSYISFNNNTIGRQGEKTLTINGNQETISATVKKITSFTIQQGMSVKLSISISFDSNSDFYTRYASSNYVTDVNIYENKFIVDRCGIKEEPLTGGLIK